MKNKIRNNTGQVIYVATVAVSSGDPIATKSRFGIALNDAAIGEEVVLETCGAFELALDASAGDIAKNEVVYFDLTDKKCYDTAGNIGSDMRIRIGTADEPTTSGDTKVVVNLADGVLVSNQPVVQIPDHALAYTLNDPSLSAGDTTTFADGSTPTVGELLQAVHNLTAKFNELLKECKRNGVILP